MYHNITVGTATFTGAVMKTNTQKLIYIAATVFSFIFITSCSNTKLTSVWMDKEIAGTSFNHILVIGISDQELNRRLFEETFTTDLNKAGIESEVSYNILPKGTKINRETVSAAIKGKNIDAVLVTHLVAVDKETIYRENMNYRPSYGYYNGLYDYYPYVNGYVQQPGYYTTADVVTLETNLYEVKSEKLVWSAHSRSFAPDSAKEVIDSLVKLVIKDLEEKGLIKPKA